MNPRLHWLWLFIIVNIIAALIMLDSGELIGDFEGFKLYSQSALLWATVLVIASYLIVLGPVFDFIWEMPIRRINYGANETDLGQRIGQLLIVLQLLFFLFNLTTGVNIAGANNARTDSPFALVWVLLPADFLFVIYYGMYRENKYFFPNLLIWLFSNFMRGWAGVFMFVIFFEWCRSVYNKKIRIGAVVFVGSIIFLLYPLLLNLKWIMRAATGSDISWAMVEDGFALFWASGDYLSYLGNGISHIVGRLQGTSCVVEVMRLSDFLEAKLAAGDFAPFWKEGLHGILFDRLFGEKQLTVGVAFTKYVDFGFQYEVGDWNVSLGYPSWFFISPLLIPVYLAYTLLLGYISYYMVSKIGKTQLSKDMLWYAWLVYLMAPWLLAFTGFIYALFVFLVIKNMMARILSIRLMPA